MNFEIHFIYLFVLFQTRAEHCHAKGKKVKYDFIFFFNSKALFKHFEV